MTHYDTQLDHLIKLASNQAWKEYAWHRAQELAKCETGMWAGMDQDLKAAMLARKKAAPTHTAITK